MRIGEAFQKAGLISSEDLEKALTEQERTHDRLGDVLMRLGLATPEQIAPVLAEYFNLPFIRLKNIYKNIKAEIIDRIPRDLAERYYVLPVDFKDKILTLAITDPLNLMAMDALRIKTGCKIHYVIAPESDLREAIEYCYTNLPRLREHVENFIDTELKIENETQEDVPKVHYQADDQPVVQYVKSLIIQATNSRASDILFQPKEDRVELRFRIDGVLYQIEPPPKAMLSAITTRIKILAGLDIAERRLPQDGRFKIDIGKNQVDIRTSCFPTIYGESVVMRLLETSAPLLGLEQLGFSAHDLERFRKVTKYSYGLVLVTGPTGSGKTTTLYTTLNEIKSSEKNIITIEDPVEYRLGFIQQSQVNPQIGFDFARGLRSILRQDPDIIMVGEIRDRETAEIAIHAALTGHLVFSTLHTNDAAGAAVRLIKMGVEPFLITSSLLGVVAQRLIRTICSNCRETFEAPIESRKRLGFDKDLLYFSRGSGCDQCHNSGYKGRKGIYEVMIPDENIRRLILEQRSSEEIRAAAQKVGMKTLRQVGMEKLIQGLTTPEEVMRVTQETEEL